MSVYAVSISFVRAESIEVTVRPELNVTHELACPFQQTLRIGNFGTSKEPNIYVSFEGVDVPECRVRYTRRRMPIMQQFSHIVSTLTHNLKPMLRDYTQIARMRLHPCLDGWITLDRTGEPQELIHERYTKTECGQSFGVLGLTPEPRRAKGSSQPANSRQNRGAARRQLR